jgi:pimeloyl-ACP methyl ester carboxylesterase
MDVILIAGLWLPHRVWDPVSDELERRGHRAHALPLPGVDRPGPAGGALADATLDHQIDAALAAVDDADRPLVVGHSAGCGLAWIVADRRPTSIAGIALVGGFPVADGSTYADFFDLADGVMPFPGWEAFEGPDSDDLDEDARRRLADGAVPVPGGVSHARVHLTDDRRYDVPTTVICPEFSPDDVRAWIAGGDLPELDRGRRVDLVDIESGHWPMASRPIELAALIGATAGSVAG